MKKFCLEAQCGPSEVHIERKERAIYHVGGCDADNKHVRNIRALCVELLTMEVDNGIGNLWRFCGPIQCKQLAMISFQYIYVNSDIVDKRTNLTFYRVVRSPI